MKVWFNLLYLVKQVPTKSSGLPMRTIFSSFANILLVTYWNYTTSTTIYSMRITNQLFTLTDICELPVENCRPLVCRIGELGPRLAVMAASGPSMPIPNVDVWLSPAAHRRPSAATHRQAPLPCFFRGAVDLLRVHRDNIFSFFFDCFRERQEVFWGWAAAFVAVTITLYICATMFLVGGQIR